MEAVYTKISEIESDMFNDACDETFNVQSVIKRDSLLQFK